MIKLNYILSMATGVLNKHASFNSFLWVVYIIVFACELLNTSPNGFFKRLSNTEKLIGILKWKYIKPYWLGRSTF